MRTDTAVAIHRLDYSPPAFWVDTIDIGFDLDPKATRVAARCVLRRNTEVQSRELVLFGEDLTLVALRIWPHIGHARLPRVGKQADHRQCA